MGKVGILTYFYKSTNYGGVLQSYALCQYLRSLGIDAEQICYDYNTYRKDSAKVLVEKNRLKRYVGKIAKVLRHPLYGKNYLRNNSEYVSKKISNFNSFVESNIPYSNQVYSALDMKEANKIYDIFICGSDQIWNPISMDENFFLQFVDKSKKKVAYAASFGADIISEENQKQICQYLETIDGISIREARNDDSIPIGKKDTTLIVPDPVFLLDKEAWIKSSSDLKEKGFIFTYFLGNNLNLRIKAKKIAKKKKLMIVDASPLFLYNKEAVNKSDIGPSDFISYIRNAEYVLTDSFHCTAFSVIFQKKFVVFRRPQVKNVTSNSRMEELLTRMDLKNHIVDVKDECMSILESDMKYSELRTRLSEYSAVGQNYLKREVTKKND